MRKRIECFEKAIENELNCALAYAGLPDCFIIGSRGYPRVSVKTSYERARDVTKRQERSKIH